MTSDRAAEPVPDRSQAPATMLASQDGRIALLALVGIVCHLWLRYGSRVPIFWANVPLMVVLMAGGLPLVTRLAWRGWHGEFGADIWRASRYWLRFYSTNISQAPSSC